jgi:hypothetical protein
MSTPKKNGSSCGGCLGLIVFAGVIAIVIAAAAGSGGHAEATYVVWQGGCATEQSFTQKEVINTWGPGAVSDEELKGAPAAIDAECAAKHAKEKAQEQAPASPSETPAAEDEVGSSSHAGDAKFCEEHTCEGDFTGEDGTIVECGDGDYSHAGGISGACSFHGGVKREG